MKAVAFHQTPRENDPNKQQTKTPMPGQIEINNETFSPYESACILFIRSALNLAPMIQQDDPDAIAVLKSNAETMRRFRFLEVRGD